MTIFIAELLGTMMLVLLGDAVVANVSLNKSGMKGAGSIQITFAWGLAVLLPAFIFGNASGAHFNPALTLGLAVDGTIGWDTVPTYIGGQFAGAFIGAILVYILFKKHFDETPDVGTQRGVFCTGPTIRNPAFNLISEIVGTFVLVFAIKGVPANIVPGVGNLFVFGVIVSIGMSLGGLTGYAINPARDLGPRIAYAVLPFKEKDPDWGYAWIPVIGPIIGSLIAVLLYQALGGIEGFFASPLDLFA
ncbi:MAG TPA: aquaporin family protein [Clostridiaceae bacterium]|nr:aquaporin family protein [Clostridiaceae bacterium]